MPVTRTSLGGSAVPGWLRRWSNGSAPGHPAVEVSKPSIQTPERDGHLDVAARDAELRRQEAPEPAIADDGAHAVGGPDADQAVERLNHTAQDLAGHVLRAGEREPLPSAASGSAGGCDPLNNGSRSPARRTCPARSWAV